VVALPSDEATDVVVAGRDALLMRYFVRPKRTYSLLRTHHVRDE
jgi:hypothetical protein